MKLRRWIGSSISNRYRITGEIGSGGMGHVLRAMPYHDPSQDVAIKLILSEKQLTLDETLRFQREAALMSKLHHPNIISFYELGILAVGPIRDEKVQQSSSRGYYIVMELAEGKNLKLALEEGSRRSLDFFFSVALQVTDALDYTHSKGIEHRDIKPQNIVIRESSAGSDSDVVAKVLDFGVARLVHAIDVSSNPNVAARKDVAGTPMYMAPELTEFGSGQADERADLYSLGCVLYEILAGRPPFIASNRQKLEREHAFTQPEQLCVLRPDVPPIIEAIIHRLLAKSPDNRYASAFSLKADLQLARKRLKRRERPTSVMFELGKKDSFQSSANKIKPVGIQTNLDIIQSAYNEVVDGRSKILVVSGRSGIGKSRLITEYRQILTNSKIRFVHASFSQHENNMPYHALANAFSEYLTGVLKYSPFETEELKKRFKNTLGPAVRDVAAVVAGLEPFVTIEKSAPDDKDPGFEETSFAKAFSDFTRCLAWSGQPLVFVFEDLHWADSKSLALIDQFFSHNNAQKFYMIVSYRDPDPRLSNEFLSFIDKFRKLRRRFSQMDLNAWDSAQVAQVAAQMLSCDVEPSDSMTQSLMQMTGGVALDVIEEIRNLMLEDAISLEKDRAGISHYQFDATRMLETSATTRSLDQLLNRLSNGESSKFSTLFSAAVVGSRFDLDTLKAVTRDEDAQVSEQINQACAEGLIRNIGEVYEFVHWRVRDIFLAQLDKERVYDLHAGVVRVLLADRARITEAGRVYSICHHINQALALKKASDSLTATIAVDCNLRAADLALKSQAWGSAESYFDIARRLLVEDVAVKSDPVGHKAAFCELSLAKLYIRHRKFNEAIRSLDRAISLDQSQRVKTLATIEKIKLLSMQGVRSSTLKLVASSLLQRQIDVGLTLGPFARLDAYLNKYIRTLKAKTGAPEELHWLRSEIKRDKTLQPSSYRFSLVLSGWILSREKDAELAARYENLCATLLLKSRLSRETLIYLSLRVCDYAAAGLTDAAEKLLDSAMALARKDRSLYGYLCLLRAQSIDYPINRDDEVRVNIRAAKRYIDSAYEREWSLALAEFKVFRTLMRGEHEKLSQQWNVLAPDLLHRHRKAGAVAAAVAFSFVLANKRDELVSEMSAFIKRREELGGEMNSDVYVLLIRLMLAYAQAEITSAQEVHKLLAATIRRSASVIYSESFENDFIVIAYVLIGDLFSKDFASNLFGAVSLPEMLRIYDKTKSASAAMQLMRARAVTDPQKQSDTYESAIVASKSSAANLCLSLAYAWYGDFQIRQGKLFRNEYLRRAHSGAAEMGYIALAGLFEDLMRDRKVPFQPLVVQEGDRREAEFAKASQLVFDHLDHLQDAIDRGLSAQNLVEESLAVLSRFYFAKAKVYLQADESQVKLLYAEDLRVPSLDVQNYVSTYLGIRSTLFLPTADAPWNQIENTVEEVEDSEFGISATIIQGDVGTVGMGSVQDTHEQALTPARYPGVENASMTMSAVIPVRHGEINMGVLFLENVDLRGSRDSIKRRQELDSFGSQLGFLMAKSLAAQQPNQLAMRTPAYPFGSSPFTLETSSWLKSQASGQVRATRESTWYLGMNLSESQYLLVFCSLNGESAVRDSMSKKLWYFVQNIRTRSVAAIAEVADVRDDLRSLLMHYPEVRDLESIAVAFTIFDREKSVARSGHFGVSRPLVLGQRNQVIPDNRVVVRTKDSRELRFWNVEASLEGPHLFVMTPDADALGASQEQMLEGSAHSLIEKIYRTSAGENLAGVEQMLRNQFPVRHYVAFTMPKNPNTEVLDSDESIPIIPIAG